MFWNKKEEKKSLPELPPLKPTFNSFINETNLEETKSENFPEINQETEISQFPEPPQKQVPEQITREFSGLPPNFKIQKIPEIESTFREIPLKRPTNEGKQHNKKEDIYVKIDKFNSARKALNNAQDKLKEMDELMKKIRETRMREEQELSSWEKDISSVKEKVSDVTKNIFEKIE